MPSSDDDSEANYGTSHNPSINHNNEEGVAELQALIRLMSSECELWWICHPHWWPHDITMLPRLVEVLSEYETMWDNLSDKVLYYRIYVQEKHKE
jgi:hypothetical protein